MDKFKKNIIPLSFMLSIPILNIFYEILNTADRGVFDLTSTIDLATPFWKIFSVPYLIWYPFIIYIMFYICSKNRNVYYKILISLDLGFIVSYIIFYFFQTGIVRPEIIENDIFSKLVGIVYSSDNPFNCFPSLHVLTTYFVMEGVRMVEDNKKFITHVNIIGILIILSTLFIKQHVIMDVIFGVVVGEVILNTVNLLGIQGVEEWIKKRFSWLTMRKKLEN